MVHDPNILHFRVVYENRNKTKDMKWKHCHGEHNNNWYKDLQRFCICIVEFFLLGTFVAAAHIMHFSVQQFAGANLAGDLAVSPQYQDQRKQVEEDREREDIESKDRETWPVGRAVDSSILFVFDEFHDKVQRYHHSQEASEPDGHDYPLGDRQRSVRCHSTNDGSVPVDCYGNNRSNGSAVEDVREWVQKLTYHLPQGPLQRVSGFDKSQGIADGKHADISDGQVEYVLMYSGFIGAVCACYDDNQNITHNTNGADDGAQAQTNCFDKLRFQF